MLWQWPTKNHLPQAMACSESGSHMFVALKDGGLAVLDIRDTDGPREVARISIDDFGRLHAMNLALDGDRLLVALGDFFGRKSKAGLAVVSIRAPAAPRVLGVWMSDAELKGAADVAGSGKIAYLGAMTEGVISLDISDPRRIQHLATFQPDVHFPRRNPGPVQHPNARGLALQGNLLYLANDAGGLRVVDVRNPRRPREVGRYINGAMGDKQQAYNNVVIYGRRALLAVDYAGLEIVDISNPGEIQQVGWWNPWEAHTLKNLWFNSPGHTNQLLLDRRGRSVFMSAGDSELQVVDITDPTRPRLRAAFGQPKNGRGVWGLTEADGRIYLGYIKTVVPFRGTWSGVEVVEISQAR